jgi:hypothetical protein
MEYIKEITEWIWKAKTSIVSILIQTNKNSNFTDNLAKLYTLLCNTLTLKSFKRIKKFFFISTYTHILLLKMLLYMEMQWMILLTKLKRNFIASYCPKIMSIFNILIHSLAKDTWNSRTEDKTYPNKDVPE